MGSLSFLFLDFEENANISVAIKSDFTVMQGFKGKQLVIKMYFTYLQLTYLQLTYLQLSYLQLTYLQRLESQLKET